ncbi:MULTISPECIES: error-prone DNA polymerase [unclassified Variovorax]|jgi:error-prone DNA polymerase|uniref:error-prone DNA polymerase n=1 Tax=unclassified Variovorax TaxID=663243 RepID=UPI000F7F0C68|nr:MULTISPECIES: error-prone DNA polymerase [unclassified Variovorax]RSZ33156.1 DNA polymerase III subunit alpha [Variovorax sp. 553]RSZ33528.1 DNA polymerase III subunit alpha [Variovorax sp. 679]
MPDLSGKQSRARMPANVHVLPQRSRPVPGLPEYAELHSLTNFSFQRGASMPEDMVERAYHLRYVALAITDECSVAGIVRAHVALRDLPAKLDEYERKHPEKPPIPRNPDFRLLFGSEFQFERFKLVVIANDTEGWGNLCEFITVARNTELPKGEYRVSWDGSDVASLQHCQVLFAPDRNPGGAMDTATLHEDLMAAKALYGENLWLAVELFNELDDDLWLVTLMQAGEDIGVPLVAAGDVRMHMRSQKPLHDVLTAVREGKTVAECGFALQSNAERHLRQRVRLAELYLPQMLANTLVVAQRCRFDPNVIRENYKYPLESVGSHETPAQTLVRKTWEGARGRYPQGVPEVVRAQLQKELDLILELEYEMFFLTVEDIVRFARSQAILCQGRGSSANSAVCYCLGITAINPEKGHLLFERFLSRHRREPPDIDVDFEHQRREEVIQYIYEKYGRERAAIAAVVICYRARSALRDVGKAIGIDERLIDEFAKDHYWFDDTVLGEQLRQAAARVGVEEDELKLMHWIEMTQRLKGFPRHLSQHVGGFVLTHTKLTRLVPVEKASMENRSVIQWEKDDLEAMGMLKVDVLALGMLSAIRRGLEHMNRWRNSTLEMHQIPSDDQKVFDMICDADTIGVFQIESRAQMSMLPRLKPRTYEDLVIEVAIVRPGPIQGGMVHPYLKQRERKSKGLEIRYEKDELRPALERTLGIPIFQEQVMQIAMIAAKFSADEADQLRRAMAAWKRKGGLDKFHDKLVNGMVDNEYPRAFAEAIFKQVMGFGDYGFPESHAASFALLVTVSSWLKNYEPACFLAALLDSQPMGFYSPSQLVQDARRHGVEVRPVDVTRSGIDTTLEARDLDAPRSSGIDPRYVDRLGNENQPAVRLGLNRISSLSKGGAGRLLEARAQAPFTSTEDLALRAELDGKDMAALAAADALMSLSGHRRQQVWDATAQRRAPALLRGVPINEQALLLPAASEGEEIVGDYAALRLTLRRHPLALLRPRLARMKLMSAEELRALPSGQTARACGIVKGRQRPQTANGTIFVTLEDETGNVNVIVWNHVIEAWREPLLKSHLLAVQGTWQRDDDSGGKVQHLIATGFRDLTPLMGRLAQSNTSRDFH